MALGAVAAEGDFRVALGAVAAEGDGRVALGAVAAEGDGHAALDAVGTALERFSRRPRGDRPGEVIRAEMMAWRRLIDRMELEFSGMVTELAGCDEDEWEGCPSPTAWIKQACRTTGTAAWNALVVGEQAARMPASARALRDGQIGYAHLALMARTAAWIGGLPAVAGVPAPRFDEGALLARARVGSVAELRRDCAHLRHAADPRRFLTEQVEEVEARFLELKATEGGALFLRGYLDTEGGATLRTALEPLARPAGVGDGRSRERRFADALVELAGHALDSGALPQHAGQRPHLQVTASLATLRGEPGAPAAELELGGPIAAETARRLGCDTGVTRVVFGANSAVLDVGRATRVPATATRRAVQARDRGCVWPGCHRPASWGELHHLRHWAQGGSTDLANLVTICRTHHWRVHEGGWRLIRTDQGTIALPPVAVSPIARPPVAPPPVAMPHETARPIDETPEARPPVAAPHEHVRPMSKMSVAVPPVAAHEDVRPVSSTPHALPRVTPRPASAELGTSRARAPDVPPAV